jgi:hypothetical protein
MTDLWLAARPVDHQSTMGLASRRVVPGSTITIGILPKALTLPQSEPCLPMKLYHPQYEQPLRVFVAYQEQQEVFLPDDNRRNFEGDDERLARV